MDGRRSLVSRVNFFRSVSCSCNESSAVIPGAVLLFVSTPSTSAAWLIGAQILIGVGIGPIFQTPVLAVQAHAKHPRDVVVATGIVTFAQRTGGTLSVAMYSNFLRAVANTNSLLSFL